MLTPKGYCQIYQIENYLLTEIASDFEGQVSEWIAQMEQYIERETKRIFIAGTTASVKKYEIEDVSSITIGEYRKTNRELYIDDCVEIIELTINGDVIDPTDYLTYPMNDLPITRIRLTAESGLEFTEGEQNISVKAKWGYSIACPSDISFACMIFTVGVINYSGDMEGEIKSESIGSYTVSFKDDKDWQDFERAKEILQNYKALRI